MKIKTWLSTFIGVLIFSSASQANKLDIMLGGFVLEAETNSVSDSASGFGSYHINYGVNLHKGLDLALGYSLLMSKGIGGDLGFGFDLGFQYFPFTPSSQVTASTENSFLSLNPLWRPFVGTGFVQRQFQSVSSNYAGFSFSAGAEKALDSNFDFKGLIRFSLLNGPGSATASETTIILGITLPFSI